VKKTGLIHNLWSEILAQTTARFESGTLLGKSSYRRLGYFWCSAQRLLFRIKEIKLLPPGGVSGRGLLKSACEALTPKRARGTYLYGIANRPRFYPSHDHAHWSWYLGGAPLAHKVNIQFRR